MEEKNGNNMNNEVETVVYSCCRAASQKKMSFGFLGLRVSRLRFRDIRVSSRPSRQRQEGA